MIRSVWTFLVVAIATVPLSIAAIVGALLRVDDRVLDWLTRAWCSSIMRASRLPVTAEGLEHVPRDRPVVITSDHQSWFDVPSLALVVPQRFRFVAKQELRRIPLWGRAWQATGHISIDRQDTHAAIASLRHAGEIVRADNSAIIIFPEGSRSGSTEMLPFKKGAFRLATTIGVDIVPVAIVGTRQVLPRGSWRLRKGRIIVRFGPPIPTTEYGEGRLDELMRRVRAAMEALRRATPPDIDMERHAGDHEHTRA